MNVLNAATDVGFADPEELFDTTPKFLSGFGQPATDRAVVPSFTHSVNCRASMSATARWATSFECQHKVAKWSRVGITVASNKDTVGLADVSRTIEMLYQWEHNKQGRMASAYVVYFVESNFSNKNLSAVNALLLHASTERLTEWSMVALLRASFSARSYLPAWSSFMSAVRDKLKDNERLERLLVGLNR